MDEENYSRMSSKLCVCVCVCVCFFCFVLFFFCFFFFVLFFCFCCCCCFCFVLFCFCVCVCVCFPHLVSGEGCGIRLYLFMFIAFSSTLHFSRSKTAKVHCIRTLKTDNYRTIYLFYSSYLCYIFRPFSASFSHNLLGSNHTAPL